MSTPTSTKPPRKRKSSANGTPKVENGRYDNEKAAADVELSLPAVNARGFKDDNPVGGLDAEGIHFHAHKIARQIGSRRGLNQWDVEDLGQESTPEALEKERKHGHVTHGGLVRKTAESIAYKAGLEHKKQNGTDASARTVWMFECAQESQRLQRSLTRAETDAIAEEIRALKKEKDDRHYPSEGYQNLKPADTEIDDPDLHAGLTLVATDPEEFVDDDVRDLVDEAKALKSAKQSIAVARRKAWNQLAKIAGAPPATVGTVAKSDARKAEKTIKNAVDVAARWIDEEEVTTPAETAAFFLPYGVLSEAEKMAAATMIADRPQLIGEEGRKKPQGHAYWQAALECSNAEFYPQS